MPARICIGYDILKGTERGEEVSGAYDFSAHTAHGFEERPLHEIVNEGDSGGLHEFHDSLKLAPLKHMTEQPRGHFQ
jgi:hypothetical protein